MRSALPYTRTEALETRTRILDVAQRLGQTRGFNGFSYSEIPTELDIRKASINHHSPTKTDLGARLITRDADDFRRALERIERSHGTPRSKLLRYAALYERVLKSGRMCLCGMLAADITTLPREMRDLLIAFFDANE